MKYKVQIHPVVRVWLEDVDADTPKDAAILAKNMFSARPDWYLGQRIEWAEDISHYVVDVPGDEDFEESEWFEEGDL